MLFYSENREPYSGPPVDFYKLKAVEGYLGHYSNYLILTKMAGEGAWADRHQAAKELKLCERKLAWWKKHPNFDQEAVTQGVEALKKLWNTSAAA